MRIAVISNTTFNIYNFRLGLINHLISKGHKVYIISPHDDYVSAVKANTTAEYIELKSLSRKGYNPFRDVILCRELFSVFRSRKIDLAISFTIKPNIYSAIAGFFSGTKTIINMTGLGFVFLKKNVGNIIAKTIYRFSLRLSDVIVFQNESDKNFLESRKYCSPSKSILINGSGIRLDQYKPDKTLPKQRYFTFLFVGRLLEDKGIWELLHAAQSLWLKNPSFELHLIGAIDEGNPSAVHAAQMERWLHQNVYVQFHGQQMNIIPFMQHCDAVVLPSYREGIPRVLLEAMALQKPFITTRVPGCKDVTMEGINGLLCDAKSVSSLKAALLRMQELSEEERQKMGEAGRKLVEAKYDEKLIVIEYEKILERFSK